MAGPRISAAFIALSLSRWAYCGIKPPPSRWCEPRTEKHGGADHAQSVVAMKGARQRRWPYGFARVWSAIERGLAAHNDPQRGAIRRQYLVISPLI